MKLKMELGNNSYHILLERGSLRQLHKLIDVNRKIMVVSDSGVPCELVDQVLLQLPESYHFCFPAGEASKTLEVFKEICQVMLEKGFHRDDAIIALGGGVVGDLTGYVAASYMRGIDFINIPTTTLAQIDSSIGGKVAVDLGTTKNILGAFYQPILVIIDPNVLSTLPRRHYINGLVEALKAGLIYDSSLFECFEKEDIDASLEKIIYQALLVKKAVVEQDEKEKGLRKILNFGHTIGHGIESASGLQNLLHGESVALGMLAMIEDESLRKRTISIYKKLGLPLEVPIEKDKIYQFMLKDKKASGHDQITIVKVANCGEAKLVNIPIHDLYYML